MWLHINISESILTIRLTETISLTQGSMDEGKLIMDYKIVVNFEKYVIAIEINSSLRLSLLMLSYMVMKFGDATSLENVREW